MIHVSTVLEFIISRRKYDLFKYNNRYQREQVISIKNLVVIIVNNTHLYLSDVDCFTFYDPTLRIEVFACFLGNTVSRGPWLHWV